MNRRFLVAVTLLTAWALLLAPSARAEEVKLGALVADLELAEGKSLADGVVLMTHGTLAHGRMEIMRATQVSLKEQGLNSLSITLSLGQPGRHGMFDCKSLHTHKHTDALDEIGIWLEWLKEQGAERVVLLGHSRGGNQTAWFASERDDPVIKGVVLVAPATWSEAEAAADYQRRYQVPLAPLLAQARKLAVEGRGDTVLEKVGFIYCPDARVTAESFVNYYAAQERFDTPSLLPLPKPTLVVAGSEDKVVHNLIDEVRPKVDDARVQLVVVDGADHFFRDLYGEEMVEAAAAFIESL